jgi:hypothetical protein
MKSIRRVPVTAAVTPELKDEIDRRAAAERRSTSDWLRNLLEDKIGQAGLAGSGSGAGVEAA